MANHIQMVMYEGNLGAAPEMRYTPSGKAVTNFRMASTRSWKDTNGDKHDETTWLKVACWGSLAEIVNDYCAKGAHVIVTGTLKGDEKGNPVVFQLSSGGMGASFEITAQSVRIIDGKKPRGTAAPDSDFDGSASDGNDIPF